MSKQRGYLTGRDRALLRFVARYRLGTDALFQQALFHEGQGRPNVSRVRRRLVRRGLLKIVEYGPDRSYVVLTHRGSQAIGVSDRNRRPFTEQSLPVALAIAWYCVRTGITRLTDAEFQERYPELWRPGLRSSCYYLVATPRGLVLGFFIVDRGGTARRLKSKLHRLISQRETLPAFLALREARRLRVTILTGQAAQQQQIRRALKRSLFHGLEIEVSVIPELGELSPER